MNFDLTTSMIFDSFMVNIKDIYTDDDEGHISKAMICFF